MCIHTTLCLVFAAILCQYGACGKTQHSTSAASHTIGICVMAKLVNVYGKDSILHNIDAEYMQTSLTAGTSSIP